MYECVAQPLHIAAFPGCIGWRLDIRLAFFGLLFSMFGCGSDGSQDSLADSVIDRDIGIIMDSRLDVPDATAPMVSEGRPFFMAMTNWPYAATFDAVDNTQALVEQHGDVYGIWLDNGLPWEAALSDGPYPQPIINKMAVLSAEFPDNRQRYVSVGLLDLNRSHLATDWEGAERTGAFSEAGFGDPIVQTAYGHWLDFVIESLSPDWLNFAIEFSDLAHQSPEAWSDGARLVCALYEGLKVRHPELKVFFSVALKHPESDTRDMIAAALIDVDNCTDFAAASTYAFVFYGHSNAGDPKNLPDNWLSQIQELIPDKPVVVAETAWPAENLRIDVWNISVDSSPEFQQQYVERLLREAAGLDAKLVTWWCAVDFDQLWQTALNSDPLASIWRDTGLYDSEVNPRTALETWDSWLELPRTLPRTE